MLETSDLEMGRVMDWMCQDWIVIPSESAIWTCDGLDMPGLEYYTLRISDSGMERFGLDMQGL